MSSDSSIELSIIFPVYNVEKYLPKCIETATAWKSPQIEFLFVNDGSSDNSRNIILKYQELDSRIRLIDKPNGGCASARNRGLIDARGTYIGLVDSDDFVDPHMFEKLLKCAKSGNYDVCFSGYYEYYESNYKPIMDELVSPYLEGTRERKHIQKLIITKHVAIWRCIYRTTFLNENNIFFQENLKRFDDLPFKVEVFANAQSVIALPECLYYYRLDRPGQDVSCDDDRLFVHFDIFKYLDQRFASSPVKIIELLQLVKVQTHCFCLRKLQKPFVHDYCLHAREDFYTCGFSLFYTVRLILKFFGKTNLLAFLAIMLNCSDTYVKYLEFKHVRQKEECTTI